MARLTTKAIIAAVVARTGVKAEYIALEKSSDGFYWGGYAGCVFTGSLVDIRKLSDFSLERWVSDFECRMNELLQFSDYKSLNELIEVIDWDGSSDRPIQISFVKP